MWIMKRKKMYYLWLLPAVFCLGYFFLCVSYAGAGSSFIKIWLAGAVFFACVFGVRFVVAKGILSLPHRVTSCAIIIMAALFLSFFVIEMLVAFNLHTKPYDRCDYVIVLGCRVKGTEVSKSLRARLDAALEYIGENDKTCIIVSGGKGNGEDISEAEAMKRYLVAHGISEERIVMEDKSVDTSENILFSAEYINDSQAKIGVVSNDFHLFRAKQLVRAKGFSNVCGISAPTDRVLFLNYMIREYFGVLKDLFTGNMF